MFQSESALNFQQYDNEIEVSDLDATADVSSRNKFGKHEYMYFSEILIVFIALIVLNVLTHQIGFAKQEFFLPLVHQKSTNYLVNKFFNMVMKWLVVSRS